MHSNTETSKPTIPAGKVPLSPVALEARVRRALRERGELLRRLKSTGALYRVRGDVARPVDLIELAHELGCIRPDEAVAP